jgi:hypothetical protein
LASIQLCSAALPPPAGTIDRIVSANAGGAWWGTPAGSTVTATRFAELDSSPMNHLLFQYAGHATPLAVSTSDRWYVGPDMIAWPPPRRYGCV